jgi:hypothetical protein
VFLSWRLVEAFRWCQIHFRRRYVVVATHECDGRTDRRSFMSHIMPTVQLIAVGEKNRLRNEKSHLVLEVWKTAGFEKYPSTSLATISRRQVECATSVLWIT